MLKLADTWTVDAPEFNALYATTTEIPLPSGEISSGITRRVWQTDAPYWIAGLHANSNPIRASDFATAGIRSGVAFPINVGKEKLGVVELFSRQLLPQQESLLTALTSFGVQIAHYCKRKQAERDLWMTAPRHPDGAS